jgi:hypothetical protein
LNTAGIFRLTAFVSYQGRAGVGKIFLLKIQQRFEGRFDRANRGFENRSCLWICQYLNVFIDFIGKNFHHPVNLHHTFYGSFTWLHIRETPKHCAKRQSAGFFSIAEKENGIVGFTLLIREAVAAAVDKSQHFGPVFARKAERASHFARGTIIYLDKSR